MSNRLKSGMLTAIALLLVAAWADPFAAERSPYTYKRTMDGRSLVELTGEGVETSGDPASIIARAQSCVARNVTSGAISASGPLNAITGRDNTQAGAGQTLELADPANGQLIANLQATFSYMLVGRVARARMLIEAKKDKFRVVLTSPAILYSGSSTDASPLVVGAGTGGEQAIGALLTVANKVSTCMGEPANNAW